MSWHIRYRRENGKNGIQDIGGRVTRMKESERCPWQVEEQTPRQEESQEVTKSRSPVRKFQGSGSTE